MAMRLVRRSGILIPRKHFEIQSLEQALDQAWLAALADRFGHGFGKVDCRDHGMIESGLDLLPSCSRLTSAMTAELPGT
jgi:hypothetical protein